MPDCLTKPNKCGINNKIQKIRKSLIFRLQRKTTNLYTFFAWCSTYRSNNEKTTKDFGPGQEMHVSALHAYLEYL